MNLINTVRVAVASHAVVDEDTATFFLVTKLLKECDLERVRDAVRGNSHKLDEPYQECISLCEKIQNITRCVVAESKTGSPAAGVG